MEKIDNQHKGNKNKWLYSILMVAAMIVIILLTNFLPGRLDLTSEGRYTITQPSKTLLSRIDEQMQITVLLEGEKLPSGFKKLQQATRVFLDNCRNYSKQKIVYSFVTPEEFLANKERFPIDDTAKIEWLKSTSISQYEVDKSGSRSTSINPVALIAYKGEYATVNLMDGQPNKGFTNPNESVMQYETINVAEAQMEFNFVSAINALVNPQPKSVAYLLGNGEPTGPETFDLSQTIKARFPFFVLNIDNHPFISDSIDVLLIVKPTIPFTQAQKLKLDQYIVKGGKVLFLLDQLNGGMDTLRANGKEVTIYSRGLNLDDLLFKYGARINNDLVEDKQSDMLPQTVGMIGDQPQIQLLPWPYFPLLYSQSNHPIAKNLDAVIMQFPNSVDTVAAPDITKNILLTTGNTAKKTGAPTLVTVEVLKNLQNASYYKEANIPLAVLLEGHFKSLYANRIGKSVTDSMAAMGTPFVAQSDKAGKILVTGDADWVLNALTKNGPLEMGQNPYTQYVFANKNFLQNTLAYFTDESGIMASRSKNFTLRMLDPKKLEASKTGWQWLNIGLPLVVLLIGGAIFQYLRVRRYR
ncbi:gliding motility-associated ABC transporter substrate-binding protein GldG [Polluticaenibacter yanchengensis]|uniref:Gliding motility-associated ABC transporter substrate-binding protein GldG n=1 Tax=Polluticaenibacter yanchengensis TaxID=3014562 RepID=A0ABT4UJF4_9BACT|nr:gliding motility-associated ABC transporter substrate-binding protein GldG [Chitinophagaceae bacterium LY-5]